MLYDQVEKFVIDSFTKAGQGASVDHFIRTAYWVKKLKSDADEAMLIAAVAHDIERAFNGDWIKGSTESKDIDKHQKLSGQVIADFLESIGAEPSMVKRVKSLVAHHEDGGTDDQNIIKDADSISFFENNARRFINKFLPEKGHQFIKKKMYDRITSEEGKKIVGEWYQESISKILL